MKVSQVNVCKVSVDTCIEYTYHIVEKEKQGVHPIVSLRSSKQKKLRFFDQVVVRQVYALLSSM
jgi:hypothetical protein